MLNFRSGANSLNGELRRKIGGVCICRDECESVVHVLWECPVYDRIKSTFMVELEICYGGGGGGGIHVNHI